MSTPMQFPPAHNPEGLPPPPPGYRYLGRDERTTKKDEIWFNEKWEEAGVDNSHDGDWTYRRAICVDDPLAPPPDQWTKPGYEVFYGLNAIGPNPPGTQVWDSNLWQRASEHAYPDLYYRRPIQSNPVNSPSMSSVNMSSSSANSTKPTLKPGQSIVINIHRSEALSRAIQEVAFAAGWSWVGTKREKGYWPDALENGQKGDMSITLLGDKDMNYGSLKWEQSNRPNSLFLDARTDMGLLIDLLEKPVITPPKLDGVGGRVYEGKYTKGANIVEFGCAKLSLSLLRDAAGAMGYIINKGHIMPHAGACDMHGNRHIQAIVLDSGVTINRDEVKEILDYVKQVEEAS